MEASLRQRLPADVQAPALARRAVRKELANRLEPARLDDVQLMVSELVTNSIVHAVPRGADVLLEVATDDAVRVAVTDRGTRFRMARARPEEPGGWGLMLVARMADCWGVTRNGGTRVWFEIDAPV